MFRKQLFFLAASLTTLATLPLLPACAPQDDGVDDLAGELATEGEPGKADGDDAFTYFEIRRDERRCVSPLCGGYWVDRVNRAKTRCADGRWAEACYVAELDTDALGLPEADLEAVQDGIYARAVIVRGDVVAATYGEFGNLGRFVATEAWRAASTAGSNDGVWVEVALNGVRCAAAPCPDKTERKLNSVRTAAIAEVDLDAAGAPPEAVDAAWAAIASLDGVIVVGDRYTVSDHGRRAKARTANQFYLRVQPTAGDPTQAE